MATESEQALLEATAAWFRVLANPTRLAVLQLLASEGGLTAGVIARRLDLEPSALSHNLKKMRDARLVRSIPVGRHRRYEVDDHHVAQVLRDALAHVAGHAG